LTAEWQAMLADLRPGDRPGGEHHSRGGGWTLLPDDLEAFAAARFD
jgi:hypothetical protein